MSFASFWAGLTKDQRFEARKAMLEEAKKTLSQPKAIAFVNMAISNAKRGVLDGHTQDSDPQQPA